ncbi:hypothetical protein E8E11_011851 [Didymella keratinophila]|nr:hypothetical protein E8E11_011851 [Didymella keratinophila]
MARTHSSYTASPTRTRSPQRRAARRSSSEDGSQYEMDLDALGLNSTFESTTLEGHYEPPVDRVDTSEVEGPEDFTMNMTYWMTADLQPAQVKSRKETQGRDSRTATSAERQAGSEAGDQAAAGASTATAASPTARVHGTTASREYSTPASDRSMPNEEKVRSFLSALPDTELDHLPNGTPLRGPRQSMLQIPRSSPSKARSLQPTVEDYDTPRKPTQQTVIHHPSPTAHGEQKPSTDRVAELQARLDQQELASRTRITELETILSYTRTELDNTRNDNYKHKENIVRLEGSLEEQRAKQDATDGSLEHRLKTLEDEHKTQLRHLEQRLQHDHERTLQTQREELQSRLEELDSSKHEATEQVRAKTQELESIKEQSALRAAEEEERREKNDTQNQQAFAAERTELLNNLNSVQARADSLQAELARATAEAKAAREDSQARESSDATSKAALNSQLSRISDLETQLQDARFSLECAQADVAAKEQLFQTNISLNANLRALRSELEAQRTAPTNLRSGQNARSASDDQLQSELAAKDRLVEQHVAEKDSLQRQLSTAHGRISSLESSLTTLRAQLADAHRETGVARADAERLTHDLQDANDRLADTQAEADRRVADVEKKLAKSKDLRAEVEGRLRELKSQHDDLAEGHAAILEDVRDKAEDAVRKTGALLTQERKEKTRLKKDIERLQRELDTLRTAQEQDSTIPFDSDSDTTTTALPAPPPADDPKDKEIASLKAIIKTQLTNLKTLKATHASTLTSLTASHEFSLSTLRTEISSLRQQLETQAQDHLAINAALDEQLSTLLSKLMKERARTVVGKRDGQWEEVQRSSAGEKELLGKVLMRQWGREECGVTEEKWRGQVFEYKFVKKER